ncbi:MAG: GGDEF and EAL domain-containing protein [Campylobacterales bacterium]|nr:GGDEF and EAL domain-containing protein [Campylobacterales bacterium]
MQYLANKLVVRYLLLLCATFVFFFVVIFSLQAYVRSLENAINKTEAEFERRTEQINTVYALAQRFQIKIHTIVYTGQTAQLRQKTLQEVEALTDAIFTLHTALSLAKCLENIPQTHQLLDVLPPLILEAETLSHALSEAVGERNALLENPSAKLTGVAAQIHAINRDIYLKFDTLYGTIEALLEVAKKEKTLLGLKNKETKAHYLRVEITLVLLSLAILIALTVLILKQLIGLFKRLESQLKIDPLTKLPNRFALFEESAQCPVPLFAITNVDGFRTINELYGTEAGNEVLLQLSYYLRNFAKDHHLKLYRTSGDEFAFYHCQNGFTLESFTATITALLEAIKDHPFPIECIGESLKLSMSCGISGHPKNPLGKADMAMHRAKANHLAYAVYDEEKDSSKVLEENRYWIGQIQKGIQSNAFEPVFQPIVDVSGYPVKHEALMRLKTLSDEGVVEHIPPLCFLALSHKMKAYHVLSKMTILKSFEVVKNSGVDVSINLCYQDIVNGSLEEELLATIEAMGIGPRITFEIMETEEIQNYAAIKEFMEAFRPLGVKLAIDDFGSGFSNFSHIALLKPDFIKIDGSLIKNIDIDASCEALVKAIITLARELDIRVIAEFVHSRAVFEKSKSLGVTLFQGYYFSPPRAKIVSNATSLMPQ